MENYKISNEIIEGNLVILAITKLKKKFITIMIIKI